MMPRYAIGIDLGTTNCALASVNLESGGESEILPIEQWADAGRTIRRSTLPSFLYRPLEAERGQFSAVPGAQDGWVVGLAARERTTQAPGRVVHSAKSWLAHHLQDPGEAILPWNSDALAPAERISPRAASAALLSQLRQSWERAYPGDPFERQEVTLTVPASFDAAAQQATLDAAAAVGFPDHTKLLEEPQAAFYRLLESGSEAVASLQPGKHLLVVDVGGGTSDFSLFRTVAPEQEDQPPGLERIAVSEHILLGGDNIDLALAHMIEAELLPEGQELKGDPWRHLLARARDLKERVLGSGETRPLAVAVPGRGSGLLSGTLSTEVDPALVREVVLEGFFPECRRDERPQEGRSALQEWGLPYAADFAVTRYLADFLRELSPVDHILFNGGTLSAPAVRDRIVEQVAGWQAGREPGVLAAVEMDLAVARGAAHSGAALRGHGQRIRAGAARGIFLEVAVASGSHELVCVLPRGAPAENEYAVALPGMRVRLNRPVRFRALQGSHAMDQAAGERTPWDRGQFTELPPLETALTARDPDLDRVPVEVVSRINELGRLRVELRPADATAWEGGVLTFQAHRDNDGDEGSREREPEPAPASPSYPSDGRLRDAATRLLSRLGQRRAGKAGSLTPGRMLQLLEERLGLPRADWPAATLRVLADKLLERADVRVNSPAHRDTWDYLTGWCLRPGFGAPGDAARMDRLWLIAGPDATPVARRTEPAFSLLWRRTCDGLSGERQRAIHDARIAVWCDRKRATPEGILLAGMLERLPEVEKRALVSRFTEGAVAEAKAEGHPEPYLIALGGLLARSPRRTAGAVVVAPDVVVATWEELRKLDWDQAGMKAVASLFLRACRMVDEPSRNVPARIVRRINQRLAKIGMPASKRRPLQEVVAPTRADTAELYDDVLPSGLLLEDE